MHDDASSGEPAEARVELPDELADRAAEELLAARGPQRGTVLAALLAAQPQHAAGLLRLHAELLGADRLLAGTFPDPTTETATQLGGHRVLRQLGEGAFGVVFLCAQERPVVRQVAVKVLRQGIGDQNTVRRFEAERQLLAALNHPTITQVFDAGVLPDGRPFFVMEFVDGVPIRRYCEDRSLSCRDRLRLFVSLCRGVAHAHKRGIVHRDLKPANVLVVETDSGPLPKIIDFGIAKALVATPADATPPTDPGRVLGTPGYMSPEQASGQIDEVDARADVFALGVMLYELLTSELPWGRSAAATDTEPMRPSARVTTGSGSARASALAQQRQHAAELRGDLDWITLKALARDRDERYATATALADDIERHLQGQPVSVGPPSTAYRLRKLMQRNRTAAVVGGCAVAILLVGSIGAFAYGRAANAAVADAHQLAAANFADATAAVEKLLVRANDRRLREAPRGDAARQALLQDALAFYDRFLRDRPHSAELRAGRCRALLAISQVHWLLGEPTAAGRAAEGATLEAEALLASEPDNLQHRALLGEALHAHGNALTIAADHAAAQPKFAAAAAHLAPCAAASPAAHWRLHVSALRRAAQTLEPRLHEQQLAGLRATLAKLQALRAGEPQLAGLAEEFVETAFILGAKLRLVRQLDEATDVLTQAEAELPRVGPDAHGLSYRVYQQLADVAWDRYTHEPPMVEQRYAASIGYAQKAVAAAMAWREQQPDRLLAQASLAEALRGIGHKQNYSGEFAAASASYRRCIDLFEGMARQFPDHANELSLARALFWFAHILSDRFRQCDLDEASACATRALAVDAQIPAQIEAGRVPRWQLLALLAVIEGARWQGDLDRIWPEVERALPAEPESPTTADLDALSGAWLGLARWHFERGRTEVAAKCRARASTIVSGYRPYLGTRAIELAWLEARAAAARGDHAAAAAAADQILAVRKSWLTNRRAADCLHLAWRSAGRDASPDPYRERAAALYADAISSLEDDVAENPDDPWFVLSWGFASLRAAELAAAAGNASHAAELLAAALPRLAAVRGMAHADQWDEGALRDGHELLGSLAPSARR